MQRVIYGLCVGLAAILAGHPAFAQSPAPIPDKMPFDIPIGLSVNLGQAKDLLPLAEAEAKKHDWKMAIAVVDNAGELVAFEKMDGTQISSVTIAINKAYTSARFRRPTSVFFHAMETGHPYVMTFGARLVASPGGIPLIEDGKIIGAMGCSGGTGAQDAIVCGAAASKIH
jgi:uncharacterized protein GlcG (DUF336 family)